MNTTTIHADLIATLENSPVGLDVMLDTNTARQCVDTVLERFRELTGSPYTMDELDRVLGEGAS